MKKTSKLAEQAAPVRFDVALTPAEAISTGHLQVDCSLVLAIR